MDLRMRNLELEEQIRDLENGLMDIRKKKHNWKKRCKKATESGMEFCRRIDELSEIVGIWQGNYKNLDENYKKLQVFAEQFAESKAI